MAAPLLVPIVMGAGRALSVALSKWQGILAFIGLISAGGYTLNSIIAQAGETALGLWPLIALACFFILIKEFIRGWFKVREKEENLKKEDS